MRRRLAVVGLATTALVVISLLVPLGLLVRRQAADDARLRAEREAQATASLVALAMALGSESLESALGAPGEGVVVATSDDQTIGEPLPGQGSLIDQAFDRRATVTAEVEGGWEMALPVIGREEVVVVDVFVTGDELTAGVMEAWLLLGALGLLLVGAATVIGDRFGRWLVTPVGQLTAAAHRLGEGDLNTRVDVRDPPELKEVGEAFNSLAIRLEGLLAEEREAVADLSHRLRTPLTSLRLQAESVTDSGERIGLLGQIDRLEKAVDEIIVSARTSGQPVGHCALDRVVGERLDFWRVLADEQGREMDVSLGAGESHVGLAEEPLKSIVDSLIGNVFAHTPAGTRFTIETGKTGGGGLWMTVADRGPGFGGSVVVQRGVSGSGSTGLGLDIVRRTAELAGGSLGIDDRPGGGAVVTVGFSGEPKNP